jgi:hypothetical protein
MPSSAPNISASGYDDGRPPTPDSAFRSQEARPV